MPVDKFGRDLGNNVTSDGGVSLSFISRLIDGKIKALKTIDNTYIRTGGHHTISITNPNWSLVIVTLKCNNETQNNGLHQITISREFRDKLYTTVTYGTNNNNPSFLKECYYAEVKITNATDQSVTVRAGDFKTVSPRNGRMIELPGSNNAGVLQTIVM